MGILPLGISTAPDPLAKDPFADDAAVRAMYDAGGILTHGRLPENKDKQARKNLKPQIPPTCRARDRFRAPGSRSTHSSTRRAATRPAEASPRTSCARR